MTHGPAPVDVVGPTRRPTRTDRRRAAATALVLAAALCVRETPHPAPPRPMAPADRPDPFAPRYAVHEIRCLARALWFEARGEPPEGRIAVAGVVLARAADPRWPKDLCATIRAPRQFSFVVRGASPQIPDAHDAQAFTDLARAVGRAA